MEEVKLKADQQTYSNRVIKYRAVPVVSKETTAITTNKETTATSKEQETQ